MSGLLQWMTAISLIMHLALFGISLLILKRSKPFVMPSPYIVNLVSPETGGGPAAPSNKENSLDKAEKTAPETQLTTPEVSKKPKENINKEQRLSERIAALKAKKEIEQSEQARASASIKNARNRSATGHSAAGDRKTGGPARGAATDKYSKLVEDEIRSHWVIPETRDKNLMAIISIKVTNDGAIQKVDFIKSSGNQLFDRSVQRAITKSRLPQDPPDTEVVLRFHP